MPQAVSSFRESTIEVLGAGMNYLHAGQGRPMLLIHGLVGSSVNWRGNIEALAAHASVYAIDLTNAGKSDRIAGAEPGLGPTADWVAAAMDALGIAQADVAGHSHGGAVALMLAARHPERVRSLVLFAPANPFCDYPRPMIRLYSSTVGRLIARCAPYLPRPIHMFALGRMYGDPARIQSGTIEGYISGLRVPGTVQHILAIVRSWFDEMAGLAAVLPSLSAIPTLLAWGDQDRAMSLASGRELHRRMSASELVVFHGAGHVVFEELPEAANRLMLEWLQRDLSYKKTAARAARVPPALANDARMSGAPAGLGLECSRELGSAL